MKLSLIPLIDVCGINDFVYSSRIEGTIGEIFDFYFQLVDLDKNLGQHGYNPPGLRYVPGDGSLLTAEVWNVNKEKRFTRVAMNPFPSDTSIFKVSFLSTDPLDATVNFKIVLLDAVTTPATQRICYSQGALALRNG